MNREEFFKVFGKRAKKNGFVYSNGDIREKRTGKCPVCAVACEVLKKSSQCDAWEDGKRLKMNNKFVNNIVNDDFINVSDEFWMDYVGKFWEAGKQNYWFPMGEMHNDIGLVSIYGALWVLYQAYERNLSVLLHCHAGINRSQTVRACFHYMMISEHIPLEMKGQIYLKDNMLEANCKSKHLPELPTMELWLTACKEAFDNPEKFLGGMYDWTLRKANLQTR